MLKNAYRRAQEVVNLSHPLGVPSGQVVVYGDDVHALAGQGVQVRWKRGHQRLAFTRPHLRDLAIMQNDASDHLHVEMPHAQRSFGGLPDCGKHLGDKVVKLFAGVQAGLEGIAQRPELVVGHALEFGFEGVYIVHILVKVLDDSVIGATKNFSETF